MPIFGTTSTKWHLEYIWCTARSLLALAISNDCTCFMFRTQILRISCKRFARDESPLLQLLHKWWSCQWGCAFMKRENTINSWVKCEMNVAKFKTLNETYWKPWMIVSNPTITFSLNFSKESFANSRIGTLEFSPVMLSNTFVESFAIAERTGPKWWGKSSYALLCINIYMVYVCIPTFIYMNVY